MGIQDDRVKADLLRRLRRIEGQTRGVARMVEEGRDCQEVLQQLAAIRAAAYQVSVQVVRSFAFECIQAADESPEEMIEALTRALTQIA